MWSFLCPKAKLGAVPEATGGCTIPLANSEACHAAIKGEPTPDTSEGPVPQDDETFTGYTSDQMEGDTDDVDDADDEDKPGNDSEAGPWSNGLADDMAPGHTETPIPIQPISLFGIIERKCRCIAAEGTVPLLKRQKRDTPVRIQRNGCKNKLGWIRHNVMIELEKQINSTSQDTFNGRLSRLQAC